MSDQDKQYGELHSEPISETIKSKKNEFAGGPEPGWDKMEKAAQAGEQKQHIPTVNNQDIPVEDVPESERLKRPVGTESDSY